MKEFKMLEATNKQEAIISLRDVKRNKPDLMPGNIMLAMPNFEHMSFAEVRDMFIVVKTAYYNSIDYTKKF